MKRTTPAFRLLLGCRLRQVIDMPEMKSHIESRIDYSHVQAPAAH